jgi:hypothetical protein
MGQCCSCLDVDESKRHGALSIQGRHSRSVREPLLKKQLSSDFYEQSALLQSEQSGDELEHDVSYGSVGDDFEEQAERYKSVLQHRQVSPKVERKNDVQNDDAIEREIDATLEKTLKRRHVRANSWDDITEEPGYNDLSAQGAGGGVSESAPSVVHANRRQRQRTRVIRTRTGSVYEVMVDEATALPVGELVSAVARRGQLAMFSASVGSDLLAGDSQTLVLRAQANGPFALYAKKGLKPTLISYDWKTVSFVSAGEVHMATLALSPSALHFYSAYNLYFGVVATRSSCSFSVGVELETALLPTDGSPVKGEAHLMQSKHLAVQPSVGGTLRIRLELPRFAVVPLLVGRDKPASAAASDAVASQRRSVGGVQTIDVLVDASHRYIVSVSGHAAIPTPYSIAAQLDAGAEHVTAAAADVALDAPNAMLEFNHTLASRLGDGVELHTFRIAQPRNATSLSVLVEAAHPLDIRMHRVDRAEQVFTGRFRAVDMCHFVGSVTLSPSDLDSVDALADGDDGAIVEWQLLVAPVQKLSSQQHQQERQQAHLKDVLPFSVTPLYESGRLELGTTVRGAALYTLTHFYMLDVTEAGTLDLTFSVDDDASPSYDDLESARAAIYVRHNACTPHRKFPRLANIDYDYCVKLSSSPAAASSSASPPRMSCERLQVHCTPGRYFISLECVNSFELRYALSSTFSSLVQPSSDETVHALALDAAGSARCQLSNVADWQFVSVAMPSTDMALLFVAESSAEPGQLHMYAQQGGLPLGNATEFDAQSLAHPIVESGGASSSASSPHASSVLSICVAARELAALGVDGLWYAGLRPVGDVVQRCTVHAVLVDTSNPLPIGTAADDDGRRWGAVQQRRVTYYSIDVDADYLASGAPLCIEYLCSQRLEIKLKKGSIPSPFASAAFDDGNPEYLAPLADDATAERGWLSGAIIVSPELLSEARTGQWYLALKGAPRATIHALVALAITNRSSPLHATESILLDIKDDDKVEEGGDQAASGEEKADDIVESDEEKADNDEHIEIEEDEFDVGQEDIAIELDLDASD